MEIKCHLQEVNAQRKIAGIFLLRIRDNQAGAVLTQSNLSSLKVTFNEDRRSSGIIAMESHIVLYKEEHFVFCHTNTIMKLLFRLVI